MNSLIESCPTKPHVAAAYLLGAQKAINWMSDNGIAVSTALLAELGELFRHVLRLQQESIGANHG